MTERTAKYPLDVSARYPESVLTTAPTVRARDRISGLTVHPDTDDLTNEVLYRSIRTVWTNTHKTLAYCDLIDLAQEAAAAAHEASLAALELRVGAVAGEIQALRTSVDSLIGFFAVIVPAWINKHEVENGDDMGIARRSAADLGIIVAFDSARQEPGFGHEDVVAIDPPPGSLIARGGTVKVTLNLEG